jgi:hypothetical protein
VHSRHTAAPFPPRRLAQLHPFLNNYLTWFDQWFPLFGTLTVAVFGLYLLLAVAKGNAKFGTRFFLIKVHPLETGKTLLNSFAFNIALVLLCVLVSGHARAGGGGGCHCLAIRPSPLPVLFAAGDSVLHGGVQPVRAPDGRGPHLRQPVQVHAGERHTQGCGGVGVWCGSRHGLVRVPRVRRA